MIIEKPLLFIKIVMTIPAAGTSKMAEEQYKDLFVNELLIFFFIMILIYGFIIWLFLLWNKETPLHTYSKEGNIRVGNCGEKP